jgi:preprotein translocase subunit YajC
MEGLPRLKTAPGAAFSLRWKCPRYEGIDRMFDRPGFLFPLAQATTPPPPTRPGGVEPAPAPVPTVNPAPATPGAGPAVTGTGGPAATSTQPGGPVDPARANNSGGLLNTIGQIAPIILMFVVLYFIMFRGQRKEEKRRKGLIAELKKGDRVMTIGGLMARVVSIDGDEVVLKIDESANVKATFRKSAIQEVLVADEKK